MARDDPKGEDPVGEDRCVYMVHTDEYDEETKDFKIRYLDFPPDRKPEYGLTYACYSQGVRSVLTSFPFFKNETPHECCVQFMRRCGPLKVNFEQNLPFLKY